jgi:hypothetical protein
VLNGRRSPSVDEIGKFVVRRFLTVGVGAVLSLGLATAGQAAQLPSYASTVAPVGNVGGWPVFPINQATYTFTATASGGLDSFFAGSSASDTEVLGVLVNGNLAGIASLANRTTPLGYEWNFGPDAQSPVIVNIGDVLTFYIQDLNPSRPNTFYSTASLNADHVQHVYAAAFGGGVVNGFNFVNNVSVAATATLPAGIFVGFEDLLATDRFADFNYNDETFIVTNVSLNAPPRLNSPPPPQLDGPLGGPIGGVPEPAAWGLMLLGFAGLGASLRRARAEGLAAA